jgi:hypothetical protein
VIALLILLLWNSWIALSTSIFATVGNFIAVVVCQQNTEEEVSMFIMTNTPSMLNQLWPKIESSITTNSKL